MALQQSSLRGAAQLIYCVAVADDKTKETSNVKNTPVVVEGKIVLKDDDGTKTTRKDIQLGSFRPGNVVQCNVEVENLTVPSFDLSGIESGCTGLRVTPTSGRIAPGDHLIFTLLLHVPKNPHTSSDNNDPRLHVSAKLAEW